MFNQSHISNYQSLEQQIFDNRFQQNAIQRNMVQNNIPQNSRNNRKLEDNGYNTNFGNNGLGYGTYINFQNDNNIESRKDKNQKVYTNQYESQFDQNFNNFSNDIRKSMNTAQHININQTNQPNQGHLSNYMFEHNMHYNYDSNRNLGLGIPSNSNQNYDRNGDNNGMGQRRRCAGVVQNNMHNNNMDISSNYAFQNFETLNKIAEKEEEINRYMERNPVNTRRDEIEKERLSDKKNFMKNQGGTLNQNLNFNDLKPQNTRKNENQTIQTNYIPNGRTMALPKDMF